VTTDAWQKRAIFRVAEIAEIICARILACRDEGAFLLHEFILMPDHLHLLLTPSYTVSLEKAMQLIKGGSSHQIHKQRGGKLQIWQPGFHEWTVRDEDEFRRKLEYIRQNPVAAKLVARPQDWHFGSACGKFEMDMMPGSLKPSGAKAPAIIDDSDVGAKAPTP